MANDSEQVDVKLPSGETITAVVPSGWSDEQIHANLLVKHPEFFRASESSQVATRPGQVAPIPNPMPSGNRMAPSTSALGMIGEGEEAQAQGNQQMGQQYMTAGPGEIGRGAKDIVQGKVARGAHRIITGAGVTAIPAAATALPFAAMQAPVATGLGIAGGYGGQVGAQKGAELLGANPDQAALAGDIGGIAGGSLGAKLPSLGKSSLQSLVRSLTSTTPERLAQLGDVEGKVADVHQLVSKAEQAVHGAVSAQFPEIQTPVELPSQYKVGGWQNGKFVTAEDLKPRQIPFIQAQQEYSQLAQDARAANLARSRGLATGFDEEAILARKNTLGQAMQDAATKDGKLPQYLAAKAKFQQFMNDFHNRGSAVEPILNMKPDETSRITGHLLSPDKGARLVETLEKYGVDTSKIDDLLKGGGTNLKIDVNEAAKLRKLGNLYPETRLNESIDQAKFNRLQSSAQARLPAWAMRRSANIPLLPEALSPNIPVRALVRRLLESSLARGAVKP